MPRITFAALALFIAASAFAQTSATASPAPAPSAPASAVAQAPKPPAKPFVYTAEPNDIVTGKSDAPLTIVEYAALSCSHCAHFYTADLPQIDKAYIQTGKARLVYRHLPINEPALKAAELVECAPKENRHDFIKVLYETQSKWAFDPMGYEQSLGDIAVLGGMERTAFDACMKSKAVEKSILETAKTASDDYQLSSTPSFFIGTHKVEGNPGFKTLSGMIDAELAILPSKK